MAAEDPGAARIVRGRPVEVRRSARRRRTVSAFEALGVVVVLLPARMSRAEEDHWVNEMVARLDRRVARHLLGDTDLLARAHDLSRRYLAGQPVPTAVRWVANQNSRWGSCTPSDGTIRLSDRLRAMPRYVGDYVLVHELAHLVEAGHGPAFHRLVSAYPHTERARAFLDGVQYASRRAAAPRLDRPDGEACSDGATGLDGEACSAGATGLDGVPDLN